MEDSIQDLLTHEDKFVRMVAGLFKKCKQDNYSEESVNSLFIELGKMSSKFNLNKLTGRQRELCIESLYLEFHNTVNKLDNHYEYNIKYNGAGEYFIAYGNAISSLDTADSKELTLYRVSNSNYSVPSLQGDDAMDIISKYATKCAKHIAVGTREINKTNSYSKKLGVVLFKYLGKCGADGTFTVKELKTRLNSITLEDGSVLSIEEVKDSKNKNITSVHNIVLDASVFENNKEYLNPTIRVYNNSAWGYSTMNSPLDRAVNPAWDNEVLVMNDSESICNIKEYKFTVAEMIIFLILYYSGMERVDVADVRSFILDKAKENYSFSRMSRNSVVSAIEEGISDTAYKIIKNILRSTTNEWTDYMDKEAWGDTILHDDLALVRDVLTKYKGRVE